MRVKILSILFLSTCSTAALADGTIYMNGQPCFVNGNQVNCPNGMSPAEAAALRAERAEARRERQQAANLDDCLRKADWPGAPSRSECQRMYGQ